MAKFTINKRLTSNRVSVQADWWTVEDGFVVFLTADTDGNRVRVLAVKEKFVNTIDLDE